MIRIPSWMLKMARAKGEREYQLLIEYRLAGSDVAALLDVSRNTIHLWSTNGRQGALLRCKIFHAFSGRPRYAYRLMDVEQFASTFGVRVRYETLPAGLRLEWNV